jgi:hypothetical protein
LLNRFFIWLYKDPLQRTIVVSVLLLHGVFTLILLISPAFLQHKKENKPLVINTVKFKMPPAEKKTTQATQKTTPQPKVQAPQPLAKKSPLPQKHTQVAAKKESTPTPVKKQVVKPEVKKQPAVADKQLGKIQEKSHENRAKISDTLLKELEESIAKIETKRDKTTIRSKSIAPITLQIDTITEEDILSDGSESSYTHALVDHLHRFLTLPDYGEVKIQLSLRQDGTVAKMDVLRAQSEKNRQYLESNLPRLKFPRLEGAYANKKESTFTLTFCNEL